MWPTELTDRIKLTDCPMASVRKTVLSSFISHVTKTERAVSTKVGQDGQSLDGKTQSHDNPGFTSVSRWLQITGPPAKFNVRSDNISNEPLISTPRGNFFHSVSLS